MNLVKLIYQKIKKYFQTKYGFLTAYLIKRGNFEK